jgi:hypothetical protein
MAELIAWFFERDDAEEVARRLRADGQPAQVRRDRFHGEDDDEDHPWTVVTEPSAGSLLEELTDRYDGWLAPAETDAATAPLPLPEAPKRLKRKG